MADDLKDVGGVAEPAAGEIWRRVAVETGRALGMLGLALFSLAAMAVGVALSAVLTLRGGDCHARSAEIATQTALTPCSGVGSWLYPVVALSPLVLVAAGVLVTGIRAVRHGTSLTRQWAWVAASATLAIVLPLVLVNALHW